MDREERQAVWRAINDKPPADAFIVEMYTSHEFIVIHRFKRSWWRRLFWKPWERCGLREVVRKPRAPSDSMPFQPYEPLEDTP